MGDCVLHINSCPCLFLHTVIFLCVLTNPCETPNVGSSTNSNTKRLGASTKCQNSDKKTDSHHLSAVLLKAAPPTPECKQVWESIQTLPWHMTHEGKCSFCVIINKIGNLFLTNCPSQIISCSSENTQLNCYNRASLYNRECLYSCIHVAGAVYVSSSVTCTSTEFQSCILHLFGLKELNKSMN